jgi:hypothetical protein
MVGSYDADTNKFMADVMPTREANPQPTAPQSPDVQPGNTAATYPDGWKEHAVPAARQVVKVLSKVREGGSPAAVITKAIARTGIRSLLQEQEKQASTVSESLAMFRTLNGKYGQAWHDWEPETIVRTLELDYGADPKDVPLDALQAFQVILNTNQAHESWHIFEKVGQALNDSHVDFDVVQPLRPDEVALAVRVIDSLRKEPYAEEVLAYMAACAKHSGVVYLPKEFFPEGAQKFLDEMGNDASLRASVERKYSSNEEGDTMAEKVQLEGLKEIKAHLEANQ